MVRTLVRRARRRFLYNGLLREGANASSAALGALILLLIAGTDVLAWQWCLVLPVAAAAAGFYRLRRRLPSTYGVAQVVDHRMALADSLSTAVHFSQPQAAVHSSEQSRRMQREQADRLAASVDVRLAVPYTMPRTAYLTVALVLVASSLFALRYGLSRRLDLKPPLARILEQSLGIDEPVRQARAPRQKPPAERQGREEGVSIEDSSRQAGDQPDADAADGSEASDSPAEKANPKTAAREGGKRTSEGDKADAGQKDGSGDDMAADDGEPSGQNRPGDGKADQKKESGAPQDASSQGENSSLLSKVKDAWQNLLSRVKPQPGQAGSQQQLAPDQKGNQGKGQQNGSRQQAGKDGQSPNGQQGDAQEGEAGEQAQNSQDPMGTGTGKSDSRQPSKQPGSGIGSQDGDKSIKEAEQLAAMGKITEILGKRSAAITGEATVEVQSTSQQLRTPYAQRSAEHTQGGAEIRRDEIPVALQSYVERYFDEVRKQAPPKK